MEKEIEESKIQKIDLFRLRLGKSLVTKSKIKMLMREIQKLKLDFFNSFGIRIPNIHIVEDKELRPLEYAIDVSEIEHSKFCTEDDSFKMIIKQLEKVIFKNKSSIITIEYVTQLVEELEVSNNYLYKCLFSTSLFSSGIYSNLVLIKKLLTQLLDENISIKNIMAILEVIVEFKEESSTNEKIQNLVEIIRQKISEKIIMSFVKEKKIKIINLSSETAQYFLDHQSFPEDFTRNLQDKKRKEHTLILFCSHVIRRKVWEVLKYNLLNITVISDKELINCLEKFKFEFDIVGEI